MCQCVECYLEKLMSNCNLIKFTNRSLACISKRPKLFVSFTSLVYEKIVVYLRISYI